MAAPNGPSHTAPRKNAPRWFVLFLSAVGVTGLYWCYRWWQDLIGYWHQQDWQNLIQNGVLWLLVAAFSLMLSTLAFGNGRVVMVVRNIAGGPLAAAFLTQYVFGFVFFPMFVALSLYAAPVWLWQLLTYLGIHVNYKIFTYLGYVTASLLMTYYGGWFVALLLRATDVRWRHYDRLVAFLRPELFRIYMYIVVALGYLAANLERMMGKPLTDFALWTSYSGLAVDVLLTFVVFERVVKMIMDHRKSSKPNKS